MSCLSGVFCQSRAQGRAFRGGWCAWWGSPRVGCLLFATLHRLPSKLQRLELRRHTGSHDGNMRSGQAFFVVACVSACCSLDCLWLCCGLSWLWSCDLIHCVVGILCVSKPFGSVSEFARDFGVARDDGDDRKFDCATDKQIENTSFETCRQCSTLQ